RTHGSQTRPRKKSGTEIALSKSGPALGLDSKEGSMSSIGIRVSRGVLASLVLTSFGFLAACNGKNDVTGTGGALVRLNVDAPDSAVSGHEFNVNLTSQNVGVTSVQNGVVTVTLPSPLTVAGVNAATGTSATFANSGSGATVTWTLNTLGANSSSTLTI